AFENLFHPSFAAKPPRFVPARGRFCPPCYVRGTGSRLARAAPSTRRRPHPLRLLPDSGTYFAEKPRNGRCEARSTGRTVLGVLGLEASTLRRTTGIRGGRGAHGADGAPEAQGKDGGNGARTGHGNRGTERDSPASVGLGFFIPRALHGLKEVRLLTIPSSRSPFLIFKLSTPLPFYG